MMRILSLNVTNGGRQYFGDFITEIDKAEPDLIALQEVRADTAGMWGDAFQERGLDVISTFGLGAKHTERFRQDGLLMASRWPLRPLDPNRSDLPWPERLLSAVVKHPTKAFEFHTAHVPNASSGIKLFSKGESEAGAERLAKKLETFEGIARAMAASRLPRILVGDFNTPHTETKGGTVGYWQHSCPPALRARLQERWLKAEKSVIEGLAHYGMVDVFRSLHGYGTEAFSWEHKPGGNRYRYDHVFASDAFRAVSCEYLHGFRRTASHHAAIVAKLDLQAATAA